VSRLRQVSGVQLSRGPRAKRFARGGHRQNTDSIVIRQPHRARAPGRSNHVGEHIAGNVGLVAIGGVPVRANPGDLVALDESATNLIDSRNYARGWIIPDNQSRDPRRAEPPAAAWPKSTVASTGSRRAVDTDCTQPTVFRRPAYRACQATAEVELVSTPANWFAETNSSFQEN